MGVFMADSDREVAPFYPRYPFEAPGPYGLPYGYGYYNATPENAKVLATEQYLYDSLGGESKGPSPYWWGYYRGSPYYYYGQEPAESPPFFNYSYDEIKAMRAQKARTDFRNASGIHHAQFLKDQAEAQLRWSELYTRPSFGSTRDLDASRALAQSFADGTPVSPAQRIRASMHFEP